MSRNVITVSAAAKQLIRADGSICYCLTTVTADTFNHCTEGKVEHLM